MEKDFSEFDKAVTDLFDISKTILKCSEKRSLIDRKNPFLTRLEKYMKTYSKTDPNEHTLYFENVYKTNKRFILLGPQRDSWLTDGNITITFGEDCGLKTDMKIHLSGIYNTAVKIRDEIREEIEGLPNSSDVPETRYPKEFLFQLYRIFREVISSDNEKGKLNDHLDSLGSSGISSSNNTNNSGNDPFSGIFDSVASMAEQVTGNKIPKDKLPNKNDFGKMVNSVMENPKTKTMLGQMMQNFKDTNNIGDIVKKLMDGISEGNVSVPDVANDNNAEVATLDNGETNTNNTDGDVNDEFSE